MIQEREKGKIKHIGVSNFSIAHVIEIEQQFAELPAVNQIFTTPFNYDSDCIQFLKENRITVTAYSPLSKGRILNHPKLASLAGKYSKTPAQIALRWFLDNGIVTIPKASRTEHLQANFDIFDFELEPGDLNLSWKLIGTSAVLNFLGSYAVDSAKWIILFVLNLSCKTYYFDYLRPIQTSIICHLAGKILPQDWQPK